MQSENRIDIISFYTQTLPSTEFEALIRFLNKCDFIHDLKAIFYFARKPLSRSYHNYKGSSLQDEKLFKTRIVNSMLELHSARLQDIRNKFGLSKNDPETKFEHNQKQMIISLHQKMEFLDLQFLDYLTIKETPFPEIIGNSFESFNDCLRCVATMNLNQAANAYTLQFFIERISLLSFYATHYGFEIKINKFIELFKSAKTHKMGPLAPEGLMMNFVTNCETFTDCEDCASIAKSDLAILCETNVTKRIKSLIKLLNGNDQDGQTIQTKSKIKTRYNSLESIENLEIQRHLTTEIINDQHIDEDQRVERITKFTTIRLREEKDVTGRPFTKQFKKAICKAGQHLPILLGMTKPKIITLWKEIPQMIDDILISHENSMSYSQEEKLNDFKTEFKIYVRVAESILN